MFGAELEVGRWFAASPIFQVGGMIVAIVLSVWLMIRGERSRRNNLNQSDNVGALYIPPDRQGDVVNMLERIEAALVKLHADFANSRQRAHDGITAINTELITIRRSIDEIKNKPTTRRR